MADCKHRQIRSWAFADDGSVAPLWSCADCGRKFVPLDLKQEDDARRYRLVRIKARLCADQQTVQLPGLTLGSGSGLPDMLDAGLDSERAKDAAHG